MAAVKLEDARRVTSAAEKKASEIGQPMNIAVADEGGNIVANVRMDNAGIGKAFSIGGRVLRHSCFKQRQNHNFCWRHPAETGWQGSRGDWRQRWFRRSGSCRRPGRRRRVLTPPDRAVRQEEDSSMSHHYSGPDFNFPRGDARLDFTDLYAFPKPGDTGKSILIMNVHPSAGENPPGPTTTEPFAPEALYELKIDTDGDAVADIAYRVRFSAFERGAQTASVRRVDGPQAAGTGDGGRVIVERAPVSMGREARVTEAGDTRFFAGWRSDPFFCDVEGAKNNFQFTGDDFFADKDVCSIVLEMPNSALGAKEVRLWARTLTPD